MKDKGFATSTILLAIFIVFIFFLVFILAILQSRHIMLDKVKSEVGNQINKNGNDSPGDNNGTYLCAKTKQEFLAPRSGYYLIELWGAQGGSSYTSETDATIKEGGKGTYVKGWYYLSQGETVYLYIGCQGGNVSDGNVSGGWNGGGLGHMTGGGGGGGGGATDMRIGGTTLNHRVMVAAGGAGAPGSVGAINGGDVIAYPNGGYPSSGGIANGGTAGGFGYAGSSAATSGSGGGSGWYGGGNGTGGSSYIAGFAGVNSITSETNTTHTNQTSHYSGRHFIHSSMEYGVNSGNGQAKITFVSEERPEKTNTKLDNIRYIKHCMQGSNSEGGDRWSEIQAIKDGVNLALNKTVSVTTTVYPGESFAWSVDGNILNVVTTEYGGYQCITVDLGANYDLDEVTIWGGGWSRSFIENNNYFYVGPTNVGGTGALANTLHAFPGITGYVQIGYGRRYTPWD